MKLEQVERLLDAGFSKDEIMQLARNEPAAQETPVTPETPDTPAAPDTPETPDTPAAQETPETPAAPNTPEIETRLTGIEKSLSALMKTIQAENRKNDSFGAMQDSLEEQTDKIMKSIIRPEIKKKEG